MAIFKADKRVKDKETGNVHEAGTEFEMTIKRAEEMQKNIKDKYGVKVNFTRLDKPEEKSEEKAEDEKGKK